MTTKKTAMSGPDAAWLRMDHPTNLMMITGLLTFDEVLTVDDVKTLIAHRLLLFDRFTQRVLNRNGTPHWQDDPYFDLDRHIHRVALPNPGDQQALQAIVSDLMNMPLDFGKPLWEMHLIENYGTGCALVIRLHHCIGDGIALIHVMMSLADEYFDPSRVPSAKRGPDDGVLGALVQPIAGAVGRTMRAAGAIWQGSVDLLLNPSQVLAWTKQGLSIGAATSKLLLMGADSDTLFKGELGATKRAAWSQPVALSTVKAIGRGGGGKVNDVLITAVCGALRRYLQTHAQPVDDVEIRALIPVNLRPPEDAYKLGNYFGLVFLSLPMGFDDPRERLLEVKRRMDQLKHSSEARVALGILQAIGHAPKAVQDQVVALLSVKASAVLTNVPGPREHIHLGGKTLRNIMFWVPRAGAVSLGISIISYADTVLLGIASDVKLVPDPEALIAGFHREFEALREQFA